MLFKPGSKHPSSLTQVAFTTGRAIQGINSIFTIFIHTFLLSVGQQILYGVGSSIQYIEICVFENFFYKFFSLHAQVKETHNLFFLMSEPSISFL
jgi:hypothetical protein